MHVHPRRLGTIRYRSPAVRLAAAGFAALLVVACSGGPGSPFASTPTGIPSGPTLSPSLPDATAAPSSTPSPAASRAAAPLGDRLLATINVDRAPCAMVATADAVWVTSNQTGAVVRIDPASNTVSERYDVGKSLCGIATDGAGRVWVADLVAGRILAIDPASGKVVRSIADVGPDIWDLKAGFGSIWAVDRNARSLLRIDPKKGTVSATLAIGPEGSGLAILRDGIWVSDDADGLIRRIDPTTNKVTTSVDIGGAPSWFADDGAAAIVVAQRVGQHVLPIDSSTGEPSAPIGGWKQPLDGTVRDGVAWIPDGEASAILAVHLATGRVDAYALPGGRNPFVAEAAFGDIWVLDFGGSAVWRLRP